MSRLGIHKTLKMYVGGSFIRSESGRVIAHHSTAGDVMYVPRASRKDLRNTLEIARKAQPGWGGRTPYNKGQILYRIAEMLEDRAGAFPAPKAQVTTAVDRAVHHAGWSDKIVAVLSSINPVSSGHVNYAHLRPVGVVMVLPSAQDGLLGLVEAICAPLLMGNSVIVMVPTELSEVAGALSEVLAVSDVPAGVVNLLMGDVPSVMDTADLLDDLDTLVVGPGTLSPERLTASEQAAARTMRRVIRAPSAEAPTDAMGLGRLAEVQTVWMASGGPGVTSGGGGY